MSVGQRGPVAVDDGAEVSAGNAPEQFQQSQTVG